MDIFNTQTVYQSALFKGLEIKEFELICDVLSPFIRTYQKKETITEQGAIVNQIGIVQEGRIIGVKYHYDGSSQILRLINPLNLIGLESVSSSFYTSPCFLIADSYCSIIFFDYRELFFSSAIPIPVQNILWQNLLNILADENIRMMYKIDALSKRTLRERIITYLSIIQEKREANTFDIGMTQEQFAQYLCVNRSALSKELNRMRKEKLIDFHKTIYTVFSPKETAD